MSLLASNDIADILGEVFEILKDQFVLYLVIWLLDAFYPKRRKTWRQNEVENK